MKKMRLPLVALVFILCCASKCKNGNNDFLARLYGDALKSYSPLKAAKEPLYKPIIGYWNLMDDRPLAITQKDPTTYEFKFMSPYLTSEDIIYDAQVNTIAGSKYISMQGYNGNYMFFKIKPVDEDQVYFLMLTDVVNEQLKDKSIAQFITAHPNLSDTSIYYSKVVLSRLTEQGAHEMQMRKIKTTVQTINEYEVYAGKFPDDPGLADLKAKTLDYSLNHASSVSEITGIAQRYPESADKARHIAKSGCNKTDWCVDYLNAYPDEKAKDSILNIAFDQAHDEKDYKYLLTSFPAHQRSGKIILSLALEEAQKVQSGEKMQSELEKEYSGIPAVVVLVNTIKIFNNFQLDESSFITNSYVISPKGKSELDRVSGIISNVNKDNTIITDLYVMLRSDYNYGPDKEKSNFLQSANKCLSIENYFASKGLKNVSVHVIPLGMSAENTTLLQEEGHISIDPDVSEKWKIEFYNKCYSVKQSDIIPDASRSSDLKQYIRVPEIESYILLQFGEQIPLYKNKQAFARVIPPNYWNEEYKISQPGYEEFHAMLLQTAKKNKLKKKYLPLFVAG